jgi:hypothetical protein
MNFAMENSANILKIFDWGKEFSYFLLVVDFWNSFKGMVVFVLFGLNSMTLSFFRKE